MEKVAILLGSPYNVLSKRTLPRLIEEKFNGELEKTGKFSRRLKTDNSIINFYGCYMPKGDRNYFISKKEFKEEENEDVPPPTNRVLKKIGDVDKVLFIGTCGAIKGTKNGIYIPTEFYETFFRDRYLGKRHVDELKIENRIRCSNLYSRLFDGRTGGVLTTNLALIPGNIEDKSKERLLHLAKKLPKDVNCADMESYQIVKKFGSRIPVGVFLYSSDVIGKDSEMNFDLGKFQNLAVDAMYKAAK